MGVAVGKDAYGGLDARSVGIGLRAGGGSVERFGAGDDGGVGDAEGFLARAEAVHGLPGGGDDFVLVGFGAHGSNSAAAVAESGGGRGGGDLSTTLHEPTFSLSERTCLIFSISFIVSEPNCGAVGEGSIFRCALAAHSNRPFLSKRKWRVSTLTFEVGRI